MSALLTRYLSDCRLRVESALESHLDALTDSAPHAGLLQAMRYSVLNGGKRVRPTLAYASAEAMGVSATQLDDVACALECIHAYSLVHDDLPAMDDDQLRRGKPTSHVVFGEATAILAGDALQCLAFEILLESRDFEAQIRLQLLQKLATASGCRGMVAGQAIDLSAAEQESDVTLLEAMHNHKTGALIKASVLMGAIASGHCSQRQLADLENYAAAIGLAFQVRDDILDVIGETSTLGKQQGADLALNKLTYVSLLGLDDAMSKASSLCHQAIESLRGFDERADKLRAIAQFIVERES